MACSGSGDDDGDKDGWYDDNDISFNTGILIVPGGHTTTLLLLVFELQFVILKVFIIIIIFIIVKTTGNIFAVKVPILYSMQHIYY